MDIGIMLTVGAVVFFAGGFIYGIAVGGAWRSERSTMGGQYL